LRVEVETPILWSYVCWVQVVEQDRPPFAQPAPVLLPAPPGRFGMPGLRFAILPMEGG